MAVAAKLANSLSNSIAINSTSWWLSTATTIDDYATTTNDGANAIKLMCTSSLQITIGAFS